MSLAEESSGWGRAEESQESRARGGIHRVHTWEKGWGMLSVLLLFPGATQPMLHPLHAPASTYTTVG